MTPEEMACLHTERVRPDWIDYNGHMNLAYYVLVFDHATDALLDRVGLGAAYREATGGSVFVAEAHVIYRSEVLAGEDLRVASRVVDVDEKRLRLFHEMTAGDDRRPAAGIELMILHVDLASRRTRPFPAAPLERLRELRAAQAALPLPREVGRGISMAKKR